MKIATVFFLFLSACAFGQRWDYFKEQSLPSAFSSPVESAMVIATSSVHTTHDTMQPLLLRFYTADEMPAPDRKELEVCNERGHYWQYFSSGIHNMLYTHPTPPQLIDEPDRTILRVWIDGQKERCKRCESTRYVHGEWQERIIWSRNSIKQ